MNDIGANTNVYLCDGGPWDTYAHCAGEDYRCHGDTDDGLVKLGPGLLNDTMYLSRDQCPPSSRTGAGTSTTPVSSINPAQPSCADTSCPSSSRIMGTTAAEVAAPLSAVVGGLIFWVFRERRVRRRAELALSLHTQDIGGIANGQIKSNQF